MFQPAQSVEFFFQMGTPTIGTYFLFKYLDLSCNVQVKGGHWSRYFSKQKGENFSIKLLMIDMSGGHFYYI